MNLNDPVQAKDALDHAVQAGDPETVARTAIFHVWPLLTSHTALLIRTVAGLDAPILERHPMLRIVHPVTAVLARTTRPFTPLLYADHARSMSPDEIDFTILAQIIAFRTSGDIDAALLYAKRLEDRIQNVQHPSRDRLDGPLWYFHHQIGSTYLVAGDSSRALLEFATTRQLGKLSAQADAERVALGRIALAHAFRGAIGDAERALGEARRLPAPTPAQITASISTENTTAALIAADRMSDDLDEVLALLSPYDTLDLTWPFMLLARTRSFLARQQPDDAWEAIRLARDSHPIQQGSFAYDVITAASVKALALSGDLARARRVADEGTEAGVLTALARTRLALLEGNADAAAHELGLLNRDRTLGPAQRAQSAVLAGWLEVIRTDDLDRTTAMEIYRISQRTDSRRLATLMPRQLIQHVQKWLPDALAADFEADTTGLVHVEIDVRPVLTASEMRVLNALPEHRSTAELASIFHVSPNTIKSQMRSLYRKLGCSTRQDALRAAARMHLFDQSAEG